MVTPILHQTWLVAGLYANFIGHGMVLSYSSCLLPGLRADDSIIKVDLDDASWLASGMGISMTCSFLYAAVFMERFGRRWVNASTTCMVGVSWLIIYTAQDFTTLLVGRLIGGFGTSSGYACGCCITAEYVSPKYRGVFLSLKAVCTFTGYLFVHIMGHYLSWRTVALMGIIPCTLSLLSNMTWPESPSWLLSKNRFEDCEETFYWLRGRDDEAIRELESMVRAQKLRMTLKPNKVSFFQKVLHFRKKFSEKSFLKPLTVVFFGTVLLESSGRHFFPAYAVDIMMEITNNKSYSFYYVIAVDTITLTCSVITSVVIKLIGRRTLLLFSGLVSTTLLLNTSLIMFLISKEYLVISNHWLIPSLICVFFIFASLGCNSIPMVLYGEIFPLQHREIGLGFGGAIQALFIFVYLKITPYLLFYFKLHGTFAWFSALMLVSLVYLYFALPETRNRTLQEIEDYFEHGTFFCDTESKDDDAQEKMLSPTASVQVT